MTGRRQNRFNGECIQWFVQQNSQKDPKSQQAGVELRVGSHDGAQCDAIDNGVDTQAQQQSQPGK